MKAQKSYSSFAVRFFSLLFIGMTGLSCKKQTLVCEANCVSINIKGHIINALTNRKEANVPVKIEQIGQKLSIISSFKIVKQFTSNQEGFFNVFADVDSSMFENGYYLRIMIKDNDEFLSLPIRGEKQYFRDIKSSSFEALELVVYPKANLKIKLNRTLKDDFTSFSVRYYFVDYESSNAYLISSPSEIVKSEVTVPTSSDVFTKLVITKRDLNGITSQKIDSIKCVKNGSNTYSIDY